MAGWRKDGITIKYPKTFDGDHQDIVPPLGVMLLIPFSALWLTWYLIMTLFSQREPTFAWFLAIAGGVAPIALGYGVITNRRWTRLLCVVALAVFIVLATIDGGLPRNWTESISLAAVTAALLWWAMSIYLYCSRTSRAYFYLIAGKELPEELQGVHFDMPDWIVSSFGIFALIAEWLMVLLALIIFFTVGML